MTSICAPAMIYLVLGIIAILAMIYQKYDIIGILGKIIFISLWTWLLNYLCSTGHSGISWILLLLPFILFGLIIYFIWSHVKEIKKNIS